jgi:hypothetical protein
MYLPFFSLRFVDSRSLMPIVTTGGVKTGAVSPKRGHQVRKVLGKFAEICRAKRPAFLGARIFSGPELALG